MKSNITVRTAAGEKPERDPYENLAYAIIAQAFRDLIAALYTLRVLEDVRQELGGYLDKKRRHTETKAISEKGSAEAYFRGERYQSWASIIGWNVTGERMIEKAQGIAQNQYWEYEGLTSARKRKAYYNYHKIK